MSVGKFFMIRSELTELVLDVTDGVLSTGTSVTPKASNGSDSQLWWEDKANGTIRSKLDENFVLEVKDDELVIAEFEAEEYWQHWKCANDHIEHSDDGESKVLDIANCCEDEGAGICAWEWNGGPNQKWSFEYVNPKKCFIRSKMNGKCMDVAKGDPSAGTRVVMWDKKEWDNDHQQWWEDKYGNIRSCINDFVLDSSEGSIRLEEYEAGIPGRRWFKNLQKIENKDDSSQCIDIKKGKDDNGAKLCAYDYSAKDNQQWVFEYID